VKSLRQLRIKFLPLAELVARFIPLRFLGYTEWDTISELIVHPDSDGYTWLMGYNGEYRWIKVL